MSNKEGWKYLGSSPTNYDSLMEPMKVADNQFLIYDRKQNDRLYTFDTDKQELTKLYEFPTSMDDFVESVTLNGQNIVSMVFDFENQRAVVKELNLKSNDEKILCQQSQTLCSLCSKMICIDDTIHLLKDYSHYILDKQSKSFEFKGKIGRGMTGDNVLHLKKRKSILLFGSSHNHSKTYEYTSSVESWQKCENVVGNVDRLNLYKPGIVSTKDERYIIIFGGGYGIGEGWTRDITIYDFKQKTFIKSTLKCPEEGHYYGIIMENENKTSLLTAGFINDCYKSFDDGHGKPQELPYYLVKFIEKWVINDTVYLFNRYHHNYWKIKVDKILECLL